MPTPNVSIVDLVVQVEKKTFAEEVNDAFRTAAAGPMKGILHVSDEPLVSVDFRCTDQSTSIDSSLTMVMVSYLACELPCMSVQPPVLRCLGISLHVHLCMMQQALWSSAYLWVERAR